MDKWTLKKQRVHWAVNQSNLQWHLNLKVFLKNPSLKTWHGGWYTVRTADRTGVCLRYSHITESRSTCTSVSTQNKRDSYEWCYGADIRCCMVLSQDVWGEGRELWNCAGALNSGNQKNSWLPNLALHLGSCRECQTMKWEPQREFSFMSSELWGVTEVAQSRWDREVPLPESPPPTVHLQFDQSSFASVLFHVLHFWVTSCLKIPRFEKPFLQCTTKLQDPKGSLSLFKKIFIYFFGCAK